MFNVSEKLPKTEVVKLRILAVRLVDPWKLKKTDVNFFHSNQKQNLENILIENL